MKSTGVVRRIDDLGRVTIPKQICRMLRIREGDPMEIYISKEGEVILKKYSLIGNLSDFATEYADSLYEAIGHIAIITDRDTVVSLSGCPKKDFINKAIWKEVEDVINDYKYKLISKDVAIYNGQIILTAQVVVPIISKGDVIGTVILCSRQEGDKMGDIEIKLAQTAAGFLGKQMG